VLCCDARTQDLSKLERKAVRATQSNERGIFQILLSFPNRLLGVQLQVNWADSEAIHHPSTRRMLEPIAFFGLSRQTSYAPAFAGATAFKFEIMRHCHRLCALSLATASDVRKELLRESEARLLPSRHALGRIEPDAPIAKINQHAVKQLQRIHPKQYRRPVIKV
jgi:hypothetical protein